MDKGGCCWQAKPDLLPAASAGTGALARLVSQARIDSCGAAAARLHCCRALSPDGG